MPTPPRDRAIAAEAIRDWIQQPPGISRDDYYTRDDDPATRARGEQAYQRIRRRLGRQLEQARAELAEFTRHDYDPERLSQAAAFANSGRLTIDVDGAIDYEAAQDERAEYRAAAAAVLADYNRQSRRAQRRAPLPPEPSPGSAPDDRAIYRITPPAE